MSANVTPGAIRGRQGKDGRFVQRIELHNPDYINTLTTVQKDNIIVTSKAYEELTRSVAHCIEASYSHGVTIRSSTNLPRRQLVFSNHCIRRLTPKECWRLMGFSDSDFEKARSAINRRFHKGADRSDSQLYKQAGNSIVVNVLLAVVKNLQEAMPYMFKDIEVGSFFSGIGAFEKALTLLPEISN